MQLLFDLGLMSLFDTYVFRALLTLSAGLDATQATVESESRATALALLPWALEWYFCRLASGPQLEHLTEGGEPLRLTAAAAEATLVEKLVGSLQRRNAPGLETLFHAHDAGSGPSPAWPTLRALVAEALIAAKRYDDAGKLLDVAITLSPGNLRLRQLRALLFSDSGQPALAVEELLPLASRDADDPETCGILGGAYKRMWSRDHDSEALRDAQDAYRRGFEASAGQSAYLGINAASTALLAGEPEEAARVAQKVRRLLEQRQEDMNRATDGRYRLLIWDQLSLAESILLTASVDEAVAAYRRVFDEPAIQPFQRDTALRQLALLLDCMGQGERLADFEGPA